MTYLQNLKNLIQKKLIKENTMKSINLNLIKTNNCLNVDFYTGAIRLKDLFGNYYVHHYESGDTLDSGYQRQPVFTRIKEISKRVADEKTLSQSFLDCVHINIRSKGARNFIKPISEDNYGEVYRFEYTPDFGKFYIEDGQTRISGAEMAYEQAIDDQNHELAYKIANLHVPFNLSFCEDAASEAYPFYLINHYAKKVPPEGAMALLKKGYEEGNENFFNEVINQGKENDIFAYQIAERLNSDSEVWAGEMRDFNDGNRKKVTLLSASRMIKPIVHKLLSHTEDVSHVNDAAYRIIDSYWSALKSVFPMMFTEKTKHQFNIMKSSTGEIMMKVLGKIIDDHHKDQTAIDLTSIQTYKDILVNLRNLKDVNKFNKSVSGQDVFRVGDAGAIGNYGGNGGKRAIALKIYYALFPNKEVIID